MPDIKLVAVQHGDSGQLVGQRMSPLIEREVIPYLTDDCVIVAEGGRGRGILIPKNRHYGIMYEQLGPIAFSGIKPTIHSDDALYHNREPGEVMVTLAKFEEYQKAINTYLSFLTLPNTWEGMIKMIQDDEHPVTLVGDLSVEWRKYAESEVETTHRRDRLFAKQVQLHAEKGKRVFFFGGVLHCATLAAEYEWPVVRYECPPEFVRNCYLLWYITNKITTNWE